MVDYRKICTSSKHENSNYAIKRPRKRRALNPKRERKELENLVTLPETEERKGHRKIKMQFVFGLESVNTILKKQESPKATLSL